MIPHRYQQYNKRVAFCAVQVVLQAEIIPLDQMGIFKYFQFQICKKLQAGLAIPSLKEHCVNGWHLANEILMHFRNQRKCDRDVFISDPIDTDKEGNSLTLQDIMADDDNIFDQIDLNLKSEQMHIFIDQHLSKREKKILIMRYGLFCRKPLTQREVAKELKISRSYVSRIEKKAIGALRRLFSRDGFL